MIVSRRLIGLFCVVLVLAMGFGFALSSPTVPLYSHGIDPLPCDDCVVSHGIDPLPCDDCVVLAHGIDPLPCESISCRPIPIGVSFALRAGGS